MSENQELDGDGNVPGLPTIQTDPVDPEDEPEERTDDEVAQSYQDRWDEAEYGDRAREIFEEMEADTGNVDKAAEPSAVIDATMDAVRKGPWWEADEYQNGTAIEKAPGIWRESDQVPEYVRDFIEEVIESTNWDWHTFESLSPAEADRLAELLKEKLTQPAGWSLSSLADDLEAEFDLDEEAAVGVAADTSHNVLATSREEAYEEMEGSEEFVYRWIGPTDHRTTDVCREIEEEIEDRGGAVTMPTLKQILRQKAQKYEGTGQGGTPARVEHWEPHYGCRRVLVREVQSI